MSKNYCDTCDMLPCEIIVDTWDTLTVGKFLGNGGGVTKNPNECKKCRNLNCVNSSKQLYFNDDKIVGDPFVVTEEQMHKEIKEFAIKNKPTGMGYAMKHQTSTYELSKLEMELRNYLPEDKRIELTDGQAAKEELEELNRIAALHMEHRQMQEFKDFHKTNYKILSSDEYFDKFCELFEQFENRKK